ncbi:MAG: hypothetical protein QGG53_24165, partial [Planctomycetota bacterium]|nr:hypothetical protein [Planctomycetota bacterium]
RSAPTARLRAFGALLRLLELMRCWHYWSVFWFLAVNHRATGAGPVEAEERIRNRSQLNEIIPLLEMGTVASRH